MKHEYLLLITFLLGIVPRGYGETEIKVAFYKDGLAIGMDKPEQAARDRWGKELQPYCNSSKLILEADDKDPAFTTVNVQGAAIIDENRYMHAGTVAANAFSSYSDHNKSYLYIIIQTASISQSPNPESANSMRTVTVTVYQLFKDLPNTGAVPSNAMIYQNVIGFNEIPQLLTSLKLQLRCILRMPSKDHQPVLDSKASLYVCDLTDSHHTDAERQLMARIREQVFMCPGTVDDYFVITAGHFDWNKYRGMAHLDFSVTNHSVTLLYRVNGKDENSYTHQPPGQVDPHARYDDDIRTVIKKHIHKL